MARYLIVRDEDSLVVNVTEWDGGPKWSPDPGHTAVAFEKGGQPGDTWDGSKPVPPAEKPDPDQAVKEAAGRLAEGKADDADRDALLLDYARQRGLL